MSSKPEEIDEEDREPEESQNAPAALQEPEIKLVINMKGKRAVIGVQATGCDPVLATAEGDLAEILVDLAGLAEEAREKWKTSPKYPKSDLPQPAPAPVPTPRAATPAPAKKKDPQNALF